MRSPLVRSRRDAFGAHPLGVWAGMAAMVLVSAALVGCSQAPPPSLEVRAQALDRSLICPVCPGETIDQSQAALAGQMQALVREQLRTGWTDRQIRQYFVDRYGDGVLAAPPKAGFNLIVWVVPPVGTLGGIFLLSLAVRAMRRRPETREMPGGEGAIGLEPYLALVDREREGAEVPLSGPFADDSGGEPEGGVARGRT